MFYLFDAKDKRRVEKSSQCEATMVPPTLLFFLFSNSIFLKKTKINKTQIALNKNKNLVRGNVFIKKNITSRVFFLLCIKKLHEN